MEDFNRLFDSFQDITVGVIGDVMLDTYMWGSVERISPEAPVPVVALNRKSYRLGGAGNVALNIRSLRAPVSILSVVGDDDDGRKLSSLFQESDVKINHLVKSAKRITTNKTRIISRSQQMMRLDAEITTDLDQQDADKLLATVEKFIADEKPGVIILEDYNKGVLTEHVISRVIELCKEAGVITAVDPKRKNFFNFKGVDIFKPNLKEVKEGLNLLTDGVHQSLLENIHQQLTAILHNDISLITLSEKGVFYQQAGHSRLIKSHLRNIADVSGAGDTVIAVAALVYAATKNVDLMAEMANIAGGLVCEEVGTVAVDKEKLLEECKVLLS